MSNEYKKELMNLMNKKTDIRFEQPEGKKEGSLYIYGPIGGFFFSENDAQSIRRKLERSEADTINVYINSPGGSAFEGVAIMNQLKRHKAEIVVHIDGLAASAASVIAMAGDRVVMPENTMMMIHRASTFSFGNAKDFEKAAKDLGTVDQSLAASYNKRFVGEKEELDQLLDEETFMTAEQAKAFGFADEVVDEIEVQELEEPEEEPEEEEEYENALDRLVAKYTGGTESQKKEDPKPAYENHLAKLFLNLKGE